MGAGRFLCLSVCPKFSNNHAVLLQLENMVPGMVAHARNHTIGGGGRKISSSRPAWVT